MVVVGGTGVGGTSIQSAGSDAEAMLRRCCGGSGDVGRRIEIAASQSPLRSRVEDTARKKTLHIFHLLKAPRGQRLRGIFGQIRYVLLLDAQWRRRSQA